MFAAILPQLDSVSDFLAEFVAAYKGVSVEEAEKLDAIEVIKELIGDSGVLNFFSSALRKESRADTPILLNKYYCFDLIADLPLSELESLIAAARRKEEQAAKADIEKRLFPLWLGKRRSK